MIQTRRCAIIVNRALNLNGNAKVIITIDLGDSGEGISVSENKQVRKNNKEILQIVNKLIIQKKN